MSSLFVQGQLHFASRAHHIDALAGQAHQLGTLALSVLTSLHLAIIAVGYWVLLVNAIVATQLVEYVHPSFTHRPHKCSAILST